MITFKQSRILFKRSTQKEEKFIGMIDNNISILNSTQQGSTVKSSDISLMNSIELSTVFKNC